MKVVFNKNIVNGPWGGGNIILVHIVEYLKNNGIEVGFNLDTKPDVVVIMDAREKVSNFTFKEILRLRKRGVKIIHRVNDNGSHRENDSKRDYYIIEMNKNLADKTIFISNWLRKYFEGKGMIIGDDNSTVIANASDRNIFYSEDNGRSPNDPLKIITHHWSGNMSKGYMIYQDLSEYCSQNPEIANFTFMGRSPDGILKKCLKIDVKPYKEIPNNLRGNDVYVTASVFESGGCHIVEGMACGLIPIVKTGGGGTEEYSQGYGLYFSNIEELKNNLLKLRNDFSLFSNMKQNMKKYNYSMDDMCKKYLDVIKEVVG